MADKQYFFSRETGDKQVILDTDESKHCIRVLRHRKGDHLEVLDGRGNLYYCTLMEANPARAVLMVDLKLKTEPMRSFYLHIAIGPTKHLNRFEIFLEKATEIGIDEITPVISAHSERRNLRTERLEKVLISAMKQSGQGILPLLHPPVGIAQFIRQDPAGVRFIAHCLDPDLPPLAAADIPSTRITILIGPEGGFTTEEVKNAVEHDFREVSLGKSRLRTETAAITAVATLHARMIFKNR
ncbi:MAG: 16S rRNA (uracil(1498)-N(3))-methyltransferase [Chlorobi bacterium]|nr:16S rRNA (uracil(1498)-N(3))-methyltransferase [Chlorobiota bacterium]